MNKLLPTLKSIFAIGKGISRRYAEIVAYLWGHICHSQSKANRLQIGSILIKFRFMDEPFSSAQARTVWPLMRLTVKTNWKCQYSLKVADWLPGCLLGMHTISIFQGQLFGRQSPNSEKGFVCATADTADIAAGAHESQPWPARHTMPCHGAMGPWGCFSPAFCRTKNTLPTVSKTDVLSGHLDSIVLKLNPSDQRA